MTPYRLWVVVNQQARLRTAPPGSPKAPIAREIYARTRDEALALYRQEIETFSPVTVAYDAEKIRGAAHAPGVSDRYR